MEIRMVSDQKVALITGAAGNLGRAVARQLQSQGFHVALLARRMEQLRTIYGESSAAQSHLAADLNDPEELEAGIERLVERKGRIDVLCNLAGAFRMGATVDRTPAELWETLLDANARSILHTARFVVPLMRKARRGKIVNIGARSSWGAMMASYSASKSAVLSLTKSMAAELGSAGINVNCVLPSVIDTPENRAAAPDTDRSQWVKPEVIAKVIGFLATDDAVAINGAAIPVTGQVRH